MNPKITIWHNKACSTSRKVLDLLQQQSSDVTIRDYISNPPSVVELEAVLKKMKESPSYILRKKDKVFQELFADKKLTDTEWLQAMNEHPSIIERPIVIIGKKAFLGRPVDVFEAQLALEMKA
jgi:arsenate reductase (glutaredoxin)